MINNPIWVVTKVTARADYTLLLTFWDGSKKIYDAKPLLDKPLFSALKNPTFFLNAKVEYGTVIWNEEIDIAPEHLYEYSTPIGGGILV